jgi:hypothetical protein
MGRRAEPVEVAAARERLRERFAEQESVVMGFFESAARASELRDTLEALDAEQRGHAAALVDLVGVDAAAELTGWARSRVVECQRQRRSRQVSLNGGCPVADTAAAG